MTSAKAATGAASAAVDTHTLQGWVQDAWPLTRPFFHYLPFWWVIALLAAGGLVWQLYRRRQALRGWLVAHGFAGKDRPKPLPAASAGHFSVAVAHIQGDAGGEVERLLVASLEAIEGLKRLQFDWTPQVLDAAAPDDALLQAHQQAQQQLEHTGAHLLVWGYMLPDQAQTVRLYFTTRHLGQLGRAELAAGQMLTFPVQAKRPFEAAVAAQVLAQLSVSSDTGRYVADQLQAAIGQLRRLVEGWQGDGRAAMWVALGNALATCGQQQGQRAELEQAVAAYEQALEVYTRERVPLDWAATQNNLGAALQTLGQRESGTDRLAQAVAAYEQALDVYTRERVPLDWAMTQNNLGNALRALGERESGTDRLAQAVAAYGQALKEHTRERVPLDWAMTHNNLGAAL
ncbi:MAG: hypothetical protein ACK5NW_08930, partial [Ottowia sp.]